MSVRLLNDKPSHCVVTHPEVQSPRRFLPTIPLACSTPYQHLGPPSRCVSGVFAFVPIRPRSLLRLPSIFSRSSPLRFTCTTPVALHHPQCNGACLMPPSPPKHDSNHDSDHARRPNRHVLYQNTTSKKKSRGKVTVLPTRSIIVCERHQPEQSLRCGGPPESLRA